MQEITAVHLTTNTNKKTRRWHVTIWCQPDGRPPQPVRPWKSGRVHLAVRRKKYDQLAVFILYRNVTDGRTDGQTD